MRVLWSIQRKTLVSSSLSRTRGPGALKNRQQEWRDRGCRFSRVRCAPLAVLFFRGDEGKRGVRKGQVRQRAPRGVVSVGGPKEGPRCPPTSQLTAALYPILKSRSFGHDKATGRIFIICNLRREIRLVKGTWRLETLSGRRISDRFPEGKICSDLSLSGTGDCALWSTFFPSFVFRQTFVNKPFPSNRGLFNGNEIRSGYNDEQDCVQIFIGPAVG